MRKRKFRAGWLSLVLAAAACAAAQIPGPPPADRKVDRLPDGRSRDLAILQREHQKSLEDVARIVKLAQELERELETNTEHILSLESIAKAEEIEQTAKDLRKRLKRVY